MNDNNPKRWFQLSLTTCIVLMVVAGVLVGLNFAFTNAVFEKGFRQKNKPERKLLRFRAYGWPFALHGNTLYDGSGPPKEALTNYLLKKEWARDSLYETLFSNFLVALTILALTAFLSEWLIRRRGRRKQEVEA